MNIDIKGVIIGINGMTEDEFVNDFLKWVESKGASFGGGTIKVDDDGDFVSNEDDEDEEEPEYYYCLACNWTGDSNPQICPRCGGQCIDGVY